MQGSDDLSELCVDVEELEPKLVPQSSSSFMDAAMRPLKWQS